MNQAVTAHQRSLQILKIQTHRSGELLLGPKSEDSDLTSIENNGDDWREIRSRVDSIANAVFLIAGGALSLSISVILGNKDAGFITSQVAYLAIAAWYSLLVSVFLFLLLKVHLVFQAYMLQFNTAFVDKHLAGLNRTGWVIGVLGFISFVAGLILMVRAASIAVGAP